MQENEDMRFGGIAKLLTPQALTRLNNSHVLIVGIGGVGSWCAEALARSGVGQLTLVDLDEVCITNVNRQLHALDSTIGKSKVDMMAKRLTDATPNCQIKAINEFFDAKTKELILDAKYDMVIDCIDSLSNKCLLIEACYVRKIPLITVGGAGGKIDPTQIKQVDLGLSTNDTLLKRVRKSLKRDYGWNKFEGDKWGIDAVFSIERSRYLDSDGTLKYVPDLKQNRRLDCSNAIGSAAWITGAFAFVAASLAVRRLVDHAG